MKISENQLLALCVIGTKGGIQVAEADILDTSLRNTVSFGQSTSEIHISSE